MGRELAAGAVAAMVGTWARGRFEPEGVEPAAPEVDEGLLLESVWEHFVRGPYERIDPELREGGVSGIALARGFLDQHVAGLPPRSLERGLSVERLRRTAELWVRSLRDRMLSEKVLRWASASPGPAADGATVSLCKLVWEHFLKRPYVRVVCQGRPMEVDDEDLSLALEFLHARAMALRKNRRRVDAPYLQTAANEWCTKQREKLDPIGTKIFRALREAVQALGRDRPELLSVRDRSGGSGSGRHRYAAWFHGWILVGDASGAALATVEELMLVIRSAVLPVQLRELGRVTLPRFLREAVLSALPRLWRGPGAWPGAAIRDIHRALAALAREVDRHGPTDRDEASERGESPTDDE